MTKIFMTKKPRFWPFLVHSPNLWGKRFFSGKSMCNYISVSSTMSKFRKKLMIEPQENTRQKDEGWTEGETEPILQDPSGYCRRSNK